MTIYDENPSQPPFRKGVREDATALRASATGIVQRLREAGHEALFVGGCVRDLLRGMDPGDYDIVTSARPEVVEKLFPHTVPVGVRFGVVLVMDEGRRYEVAAYRVEGGYEDGRRPSHIRFATAKEDVRRRDFTVNGLLLDPFTGEVIDYVGGRDDLIGRSSAPSEIRTNALPKTICGCLGRPFFRQP